MKYIKLFEDYSNPYVDKIEELKKYEGENFFPLGKLYKVSYSNLGQTLILKMTGDVPTSMKNCDIVIVHPNSDNGGWVGIGKIGFVLECEGVDISKITLPIQTVEILKKIYTEYTDISCNIIFKTGVNITKDNDATQFAKFDFYRDEIKEARVRRAF